MLKQWIKDTDGTKSKPSFLFPQQFSPFPRIEERSKWKRIAELAPAEWQAFAEAHIGYSWPALRAESYAVFGRKGDLMTYLNLHFERRSVLGALVVAELLEGEGRYLDEIINGIYCICEETTWVVPHHNSYIKHHPPESMPDDTDIDVELASAETGALLALIHYLLAEPLDRVSKRIRRRIEKEVDRRLIEPYLSRDDYWWMGFSGAKHVNNWNPWCNGNLLICFLFMIEDETIRTKGIHKVMRSLDEYIVRYPEDGCCDEGPMYWESSGGWLYRCLDMLQLASDGVVDGFSNPHIQEIGRYIYRVHIDGEYFVDFADGDAKVNAGFSAFGYGLRIEDENLIRLGASTPSLPPERFNWFSLYKVVSNLCEAEQKEQFKKKFAEKNSIETSEPEAAYSVAPYIREAWMPVKQVMTARETAGSRQGLYLAAKGGDNDESHNHNDVGNFIVYADGSPVLIDLGTEFYRAQTFSPQRYELWYLQSQYHNLPTINGVMQHVGEMYRATEAVCTLTDERAELTLELAHAYPEEANIESWHRTCALVRGNGSGQPHAAGDAAVITIVDEFKLGKPAKELFYSLITPCEPHLKEGESGVIVIEYAAGRRVQMAYDANHLDYRVEHIKLKDERLKGNWGPDMYRIVLTERDAISSGVRTLRVAQDNANA